MKKEIVLVFIITYIVIVAFGMLGVSAATSGNFTYTVSNDAVTITGLTSYEEIILIPGTISGRPVTGIADSVFSGRWYLESVSIPDSVQNIGASAFYGCTGLKRVHISSMEAWCNIDFDGEYANPLYYADNLYLNGDAVTELVIPEGVTQIGDYSFRRYSSITSITIPDSVTSIGNDAFYGCSSLTRADISAGVTNVEKNAFRDCTGLEEVHITSMEAWCNIDFDGEYANPLYYADNLYLNGDAVTELVIPEGVASIGDYAFYGCSSLTRADISADVTSVEQNAFRDCTGLKEVHITNMEAWCNIDFDGEYANPLYYADNLYLNGDAVTELVIPESVTSIGNYVFYSCSNLVSITIPKNVTSIGDYAFFGCNNLMILTMPDSVISIGNYAFSDCPDYVKVVYGVFEGQVKIIDWKSSKTTAEIPMIICGYPVTRIENYAFSDCSNLTSIFIPDSITSIGSYAFDGCDIVTTLIYTVVNGEATIKVWNTPETEIVIPETIDRYPVTGIGTSVFSGRDDITSITIPKSITSIGQSAFKDCTGLEEVHITSVEAWCNIDFYHKESNPLYYAKKLYLNGNAVTDLVIPEGAIRIGRIAFLGCSSLTGITIPDSVTSIGNAAFSKCTGLTNITIPDSVTNIGAEAFWGCTGLTRVDISGDVTSVGQNAFRDCPALKEVHITNVESWCNIDFDEEYANPLYYADNLYLNGSVVTELVIPDGVTHIGSYAFFECSSIKGITIPDSVASIGNAAFFGCTNLACIAVSDSMTDVDDSVDDDCDGAVRKSDEGGTTGIGTSAFSGCDSLTKVTIPVGVTSIGKYAFYGCTGLTRVDISNGVTSIGQYAFEYCTGLKEVHITSVEAWCNIDFDGEYANPLYYADNLHLNGVAVSELVIPEDITSIGDYAFYGCRSITSITIPDSVTSIGNNVFSNLSNLRTVYYTGTEEEFLKISINPYNNDLKNADVICFYGMDAAIISAPCVYDNNKVSATINLRYLKQQAGTLCLAIYYNSKLKVLKTVAAASGETEKTIEIENADESYIGCDVKVFYWDSVETLSPFSKHFESKIESTLDSVHPYENYANETKTYTYEGECSSIDVTFSCDTEIEKGYDYIYIYDATDKCVGKYTGTMLAGKTVNVSGNTIKIKLTSDGSATKYGYRIESIVVNK